ncbi:hypothetical protein DICPUDRAFT_146525 [Dictyostelium purpureum]|uniref:Uncharacterized protein n=1 Tax=Dictyostelium purpureum TaxID=5786 RepID=F0Z671_DICPU|nr:uncharacterized protein DICPUDRAFT_146525 [Dictyostelium purpureum]EGC40606.1 hypothetical protein DICPUDRAFT_146525 [Dictyostelium purpureum]|eukprot:XP_003282942.1 hypothetical protein DICPUDRAFT_146525 [Dictyostelium purpureum]
MLNRYIIFILLILLLFIVIINAFTLKQSHYFNNKKYLSKDNDCQFSSILLCTPDNGEDCSSYSLTSPNNPQTLSNIPLDSGIYEIVIITKVAGEYIVNFGSVPLPVTFYCFGNINFIKCH